MGLKKKLQTKDTIEAWTYETEIYAGISVGVFDKMIGNSKSIISIESANEADGIVSRIVINKVKAEEYGFKIVIDTTECQ